MTASSKVWPHIPMPPLLLDESPSFGNRDPETSGDTGPVYSDAERDAAKADIDDPVAGYARRLWTTLNDAVQYLRDDVAQDPAGPVLTERTPVLKTEEQWQTWMAVCASALSVLAGPAGDEGYGQQEARLQYQNNFLYRTGQPN